LQAGMKIFPSRARETMGNKIRIGLVFGGKSAEHEISLQSAKNILDALDKGKYQAVLIGIDKEGKWLLGKPGADNSALAAGGPLPIPPAAENRMALMPGDSQGLLEVSGARAFEEVDVIFPVLHGPYGEDGSVQGLLKLAGIPFVGPSILGSAVSMDKDFTKRLLRDAGIKVADFLVFHKHRKNSVRFEEVSGILGLPFFVKPANLGSSVGISKVRTESELRAALEKAFAFDRKILIERAIKGREIECGILGNENPSASVLGEVLPKADFYSYEAKYIDENGAALELPARLSGEKSDEMRRLALRAFDILACEGMARVDFFLTEEGEILVNEVNTIPGFTRNSMYPKLWELSGVPYPRLIDRLVELALERHAREKELRTSYQ
jgi:D-alanine-D-alanine ligase